MEERSIELDGHRYRYLERPGPGAPLLLLHGLGDSADQFEPIASLLPEDWRLLALDQRGHGGSWRPEEGYSPLDFAGDLLALLEALSVPAAHLVGHSMGGRNALVLAARHPERAAGLVLGDIGPEENRADIEATCRFFDRLPARFPTRDEALAHWRKRKPGYGAGRLEPLMKNLEPDGEGGLRWRFSREACKQAVTAARSRGWWEFLPLVRCPILLLHVEGSPELPEEVAGRMRREVPDMRYARVPESGHNFHLENPGFAAAEIRAFIEQLEERRE